MDATFFVHRLLVCHQWSRRDIALDNAEECEYYMAYQSGYKGSFCTAGRGAAR